MSDERSCDCEAAVKLPAGKAVVETRYRDGGVDDVTTRVALEGSALPLGTSSKDPTEFLQRHGRRGQLTVGLFRTVCRLPPAVTGSIGGGSSRCW
uniref:uncharacterized protein isoform X3 n=1 Tax=Pristiophorus japonicus TaxID=55135 RepID=UPI00398E8459